MLPGVALCQDLHCLLIKKKRSLGTACADPESFFRGSPTLTTFLLYFYVDTINDGGQTLDAGMVAL